MDRERNLPLDWRKDLATAIHYFKKIKPGCFCLLKKKNNHCVTGEAVCIMGGSGFEPSRH